MFHIINPIIDIDMCGWFQHGHFQGMTTPINAGDITAWRIVINIPGCPNTSLQDLTLAVLNDEFPILSLYI